MSYIFPSVTINYITYTAKRWGQSPTIAYITGGVAGSEVVVVNGSNMAASTITIKIQSGVSTNAQIVAALNKNEPAIDSLYARDLVSFVITSGHESATNTAVSPTSLTGASVIPAPVETPSYQFIGLKADVASMPLLTPVTSGMHRIEYYMVATAGVNTDAAPTLFVRWTDKTTSQQAYASVPASGNATLWATGTYSVWCEASHPISLATSGGAYVSAVYDIYAKVTKI